MAEILKIITTILQMAGKLQLDIETTPDGKWKICITVDPKTLIK